MLVWLLVQTFCKYRHQLAWLWLPWWLPREPQQVQLLLAQWKWYQHLTLMHSLALNTYADKNNGNLSSEYTLLLQFALYSAHLTSCSMHCFKFCLYWMYTAWLVTASHVAENGRDGVHSTRLERGHVKWCKAFQCGMVQCNTHWLIVGVNFNTILLG